MAERVLIVDDEREIADLVALYLENEGYEIIKFYAAMDALAFIGTEELDLAILDVMMPDMNGFALCQKIREAHTYPVIMLTAKDDEIDKITGLTLGADDYIVKPFRPLEMVARVKAQLRRHKRYGGGPVDDGRQNGQIIVSGLGMDGDTHTCNLDEKPWEVTPTEFSILDILC